MLKLQTFKPALAVRCPSPFGLKGDALLAMSGLPYEREFADIRKAPRGKFPVLVDGETIIPDTSHIQRYLEQNKGIQFEAGLNADQLATATAYRRLIEHHFYFINGLFRWTEHADAVRDAFFIDAPRPLRRFIFRLVQKGVIKTAHLQGLGRHTRDELIAFARNDIDAIVTQLDFKPYFFGDQPTSIDASLYGALSNLIDCELDTPVKAECLKHENLIAYCARFKEDIFND